MSLEELKNTIDKKHGKGKAKIGTEFRLKTPVIASTGSFALDIALGCGGLPEGRILEYYGKPSGGKSYLSLVSAIEVQKSGGNVAIIDLEGTYERGWFENLGGDSDKLLLSQPDTGAEALDITEMLVKSDEVNFIIVDSVSAMLSNAELDGGYEDAHIGQVARLMSQGMKKLNTHIKKSKCTVLFINQIRQGIGMFVSPVQTSGGNALKFYASIRLSVNRGEVIGDKEDPAGFITKIKVEKNKCGPPFRVVLTNLYIGKDGKYGIDKDQEVIDLAIETGLIKKGGAWYSYGEEKWQGKEKVIEYMKNNLDVFKGIKDEIVSIYVEGDVPEEGSYNDHVNEELAKKERKPREIRVKVDSSKTSITRESAKESARKVLKEK